MNLGEGSGTSTVLLFLGVNYLLVGHSLFLHLRFEGAQCVPTLCEGQENSLQVQPLTNTQEATLYGVNVVIRKSG